ncbi:MAG: sialate O-acetylesterase [Candidatus Latescibacterota bacterium]
MSEIEQTGAIVESGPADWQIVQRDGRGLGQFALAGRWVSPTPGKVEVRLADEATSAPLTPQLDWHAVETRPDGTWGAVLADIPAGGLYRLETRFHTEDNPAAEWSVRGDMRHHVGVGEVWVIAGQSNSAGYGRGSVLDPPELGLHVLRNSEQWALATHPLNDSTDTRHPVNREGGNSAHAPHLHFARLLKQALGCPVGLVQTALGGSPLGQWNPGEGDAALFHNMVHCVRLAGGKARGVVWYQGESDASPELGATYAERFVHAVRCWRQALDLPDLAVVTVQLNRVTTPATPEGDLGWSLVREAQRRVPRLERGIAVVPAVDLPLSDQIHTSPAGNLILGERMARAALQTVYGVPQTWRAPEIRRAWRAGDGVAVVLEFDHVQDRLEALDLTTHGFRVESEGAVVPIGAVRYPGGNVVRLLLEGPLAGPAAVHAAWGVNPPPVPVDVQRQMPILAFHGVPIE